MVSLVSGETVAKGLDNNGHQVLKMDPAAPEKVYTMTDEIYSGEIGELPIGEDVLLTPDKIETILTSVPKYSVDLIFPMLHGGWGEDGRLQAVFEIAGVPFVGSGSAASSLAMNKHLTKRVVSTEGVLTPECFMLPREELPKLSELCLGFDFPLVIKPNTGGSSINVSIVKNEKSLKRAVSKAIKADEDLLVERYIPGRELTVGVLDGASMSVVETVPRDGFYDYKHKYTSGQSEYICPAEIDTGITTKCLENASIAFNLLGCEIFGRVDFRLSKTGELHFLEVNTLPGMTEHSLVPKSAAALGMTFEKLVNRIVVSSMNR